MAQLDGRVAIITGGASGIGAATTRRFVREGACVVVADLLEEKGARLEADFPRVVEFVRTDVSREEDVARAVAVAMERFGHLDCLFNNAGLAGVDEPIAEIPVEGFDATMAVLLGGVFLGMKHAAPIMVRQGAGSIINTGSVAGLRTGLAPHVYSAAKAGVIHLTRSVAMELGEKGVRVNCICPGGIATPIFGRGLGGFSPERADDTIEAINEALAGMQPIQRPGQPDDIAAAAVWLASDASSFVNGHALVVDGGLTGGRGWSESQAMWNDMRALMGISPKPAR